MLALSALDGVTSDLRKDEAATLRAERRTVDLATFESMVM